jgi:uncharacterized membrane protein YfhO
LIYVLIGTALYVCARLGADKGWRCLPVDGESSDLILAEATMLSTLVNEGSHTVVFEFTPSSMGLAFVAMLLTLAFWLVAWIWYSRYSATRAG